MAKRKGSSKGHSHTGHRSADDGRFITKKQADRKPKESVREQIPDPGYGTTGRGKKGKK